MKMATLFSGIGAPEVAASRLGIECIWCAEIEPFPSAVLTTRFPHTPNLGDVTAHDFVERAIAIGKPDIIVAGAPCQAFSVAGLRKSLDDARGNLTLRTVEICDEIRPALLVFENVPGILSTGDNAFGCFLGALSGGDDAIVAPEGGWPSVGFVAGRTRQIAWRIVDSQYFSVAQRRRRLFLCAQDNSFGDARNWACASALFPVEEGVRRDSASGVEAGEGTAVGAEAGVGERGEWSSGGLGTYVDGGGKQEHSVRPDAEMKTSSSDWPAAIAPTLNAHFGDKQGLEDQHALNGGGCLCRVRAESIR